jgi:hypothetical protein
VDFDQAIHCHKQWKENMLMQLSKPHDMDADKIGADHYCELGHWIYGDGRRFEGVSEYIGLKRHHAAFHKEAAKIIITARTDRFAAETMLRSPHSSYNLASIRIIESINKIKGIVNKTSIPPGRYEWKCKNVV